MKSIQHYIKPSLSRKSHQFADIKGILEACLPTSCHSQLDIANIVHKQLVLLTHSAVWASRLRLYTNTMLDMLKQYSDYDITHIKIQQVQTRLEIKPRIRKKQRQMTAESGKLIAQTASYIEDEKLRNALLRLSQRAHSTTED